MIQFDYKKKKLYDSIYLTSNQHNHHLLGFYFSSLLSFSRFIYLAPKSKVEMVTNAPPTLVKKLNMIIF
jgi:hypothetical protein